MAIEYEQVDEYTYAFSAITTSVAGQFYWDFGDGEFSDEPNPTHTFAESPGFYLVTVTFTSADGCTATATAWIVVGPECTATIIAIPLEEEPLSIAFGAIASGEVVGWWWEFGDGQGSDEGAPVHHYEAPGVYVVSLTITTASGCTYTTQIELEVGGDICDCPDVWDPVCIAGFGGLITFPNACEAICAGFSPDLFVPCDECPCPAIWDPVCVVGPEWQYHHLRQCL